MHSDKIYLCVTLDHFIFIINSRSGRNKNEVLHKIIEHETKALHLSSDIHITKQAQDVELLVKEYINTPDTYFIAVGGDGTVNVLAKNLVKNNGVMGILPKGSGNGLAKHLHIPKNIHHALVRYSKKRIQTMDAITINDEWSFNVAGIGFDGYISSLFGKDGKRGMRNYMKLIHKEYKKYQPINMEIAYGFFKIEKPLLQLAIANASQYGNNVLVAPNANLQDQLLDIAMINKIPVAQLPAFFMKLFSGHVHRSKYYSAFKTNQLKVKTSEPAHFHTDGDGKGMADAFEINLVPNCLRILY